MVFGTDYNNKGIITSKGDIALISEEENLKQALIKRLWTWKGAYSYFDTDFGSYLRAMLSEDYCVETMEHICLLVETELSKDIRVQEVEAEYNERKVTAIITLFNNEKFILNVTDEIEEEA
jgi:hypothetical protein